MKKRESGITKDEIAKSVMEFPDENERPQAPWQASLWKRIQTEIETKQHQIYEEIKNYPKPIPACDAQFNYLLEERASIDAEIDRLHQAIRESMASEAPTRMIAEFVRSCRYLDGESKQQIARELENKSTNCQG